MDILAAIIVFLLCQIILAWPTTWQIRVLLFVVLLLLVLFGYFGTSYWPHGGAPARLR